MTHKDHEENQQLIDVATSDDFVHIKPALILSMSNSLDFHALEQVFLKASREAKEAEDLSAVRAYKVLAVICSYHFNPGKDNTFTPQLMMEGKRTLIPSDYIGVQQEILQKIAPKINHPLLRARIADSCWYSNRKLHLMAELAASSYFSAAKSFFKKELLYQCDSNFDVPNKLVDIIERALAIYSLVGKKGKIPEETKEIFTLAHQTAKNNSNLVAFNRLSVLGQLHGLLEWKIIATEAEAMATANKDKQYAEAVKKVWHLAARAYLNSGQKDASTRCKVNAIEQTLRMRDAVSSAMAKASWTRDAIGELRTIGGMQARIEILKKELQQYEEESLSEFGEFSIPIDLTEERETIIEEFKVMEVKKMLLQLAFIAPLPKKIDLQTKCLERRNDLFLASMFGKSYSDEQGKVIAKAPAASLGDSPSEEWFDHECLNVMSLHYHMLVEGFIKPACITMCRYQSIEERHLEPIVAHSPFVPPGHEYIFSNGFARLIQGDMVSAAHLLIPQLENSIRYVLNNRGTSTAKMNINLTQEDQSLSQMYLNRKEELEQVFGVDATYVIYLLFHLKGGPMLRHEMAHGKFTVSHSYHSTCTYACWLIYYLTCVPIYSLWDTHISKEIQEFTH